jgi:hypothetical protein
MNKDKNSLLKMERITILLPFFHIPNGGLINEEVNLKIPKMINLLILDLNYDKIHILIIL